MVNERSNRKKTAIVFTFVVGIIVVVMGTIGVVSVFIINPALAEEFIMYVVILPMVFNIVPLIAAFISKKNLGAAGIILVVLGLYNIIGHIYVLSTTFSLTLLIINLPDVFILAAGILCLTAKGSKDEKEINSKKIIRDFDTVENIEEIIQNWAKKSDFSKGNPLMKETMDIENITYCYHSLNVNSCTYITVNIADDKVHMESWIEYDFILRLLTIFIVPKQQRLDAKSPIGLGARLSSKGKVSDLLEALSQEKL